MKEQTQNKSSPNFLKTDGGKTKSNAIEVPSISLPKGGGAIKGIDEKFSVNAVNGTAAFSIPLPFSPARGASPELSLSYNSGAGNGIFGLGWGLSLGSIKRKTDKGLPEYLDTIESDTWYHKHNLGGGHFEQAKLVSPKPSFAGLGGALQLADLDADGGKQLVSYGSDPKGYFELDDDNEWYGLKSFKTLPNIDFGDPNTRTLDLNGDGKPEVVISKDEVFTWYTSEGREGFSAAQNSLKPFDEEEGPHIIFADQKQSIYLADISYCKTKKRKI